MSEEIKTKCLCSKCPIGEKCMEHELSVHDKITADLETARAERDEALEENKGIIYLTPVGVGRVMWVFDDALGAMPISRPWKNKNRGGKNSLLMNLLKTFDGFFGSLFLPSAFLGHLDMCSEYLGGLQCR